MSLFAVYGGLGPLAYRLERDHNGSVSSYPQRIVCLTEETTETLYLLGAGDRVVGVSGYTVRPPEAREKPRVSAFLSAKFDKIEALEPDMTLPTTACSIHSGFTPVRANAALAAIAPSSSADTSFSAPL